MQQLKSAFYQSFFPPGTLTINFLFSTASHSVRRQYITYDYNSLLSMYKSSILYAQKKIRTK